VARHPDLAIALGQNAMREVDRHYAFRAYLFDVCEYLGMILPRVTVIVPNYNYARHIVARLQSIVSQTIPIFEIIILDDASTDDSVDVIASWLEQNNVEANLIVNDRNSGSVVRQWAKGVALARGEYVWIAEADDLCSSDMLQILLRPFYDREVVLSYCESKQIDEAGAILAPDYHEYLKDVSASQWRRAYVRDGKEEIAQALAIKNTIPNVSGVVFRRETLASILSEKLETIAGYRQAADWYVYIEVLEHGKVAFSPRNCNAHRRHSTSVVGAAAKTKLLMEITCIQQLVAERHDLSDMTSLVAERYLGTLKSQFGLAERAEITK
jgi:glycosyltransferase involved in cell wall biosynthesis